MTTDTLPTQLGKYQIKRELGKGAMGIVYEGLDPLIERTVAIKVIQKSLINESEAQEAFSRFRREAQAAGRLTHPNIIAIYEYGEDNDSAFIAMELVQGRELKDYFSTQRRFDIGFCLGIMQQLLAALEYSHSKGVVHRDIKPANIMITREGQVKIADFGIAKIESSELTQAGTVLGTPTYMSPEQIQGIAVDARSDLYSVGVLLYHLLTGERPFTGTLTAIMHKVLNEPATPPIVHNAALSEALNRLILKAMSKRPEERFQSAAEFWRALHQAAQAPASAAPQADATLVLDKTISTGTFTRPPSALSAQEQRAQIEARHRAEMEAKRQREQEEQAGRSQRLAALKAAAEAKHKAEQAELARRAQMKAAAKTGSFTVQPGASIPTPPPAAAQPAAPVAAAPAPQAAPEKKGFFAWLARLFGKK